MKLRKYISTLAAASLMMLSACDSDLEKVTYNDETATAPTLSGALAQYYELKMDNADQELFKFTWTKADMGYPAEITNNVVADLAGKNFANKVVLASLKGGDTSTMKVGEVNNRLLTLLKTYEMDIEPLDLEIRLESGISQAAAPLVSNALTTEILPYPMEREYPKIYVVGSYCGWGHGSAQFAYDFTEAGVYAAVIDFGTKAAEGFKFTPEGNWDADWGAASTPEAEAATVSMTASGGANIECYSRRFYRLSFNTNTLVLSRNFAFDVLSVVGDAGSQVSGWGGSEVDMHFDTTKQRFWADVTLADGDIKFRTDNDWNGLDFGRTDAEGILTQGGDNISVSAGQYRIYVNLNNEANMTYQLVEEDFGK